MSSARGSAGIAVHRDLQVSRVFVRRALAGEQARHADKRRVDRLARRPRRCRRQASRWSGRRKEIRTERRTALTERRRVRARARLRGIGGLAEQRVRRRQHVERNAEKFTTQPICPGLRHSGIVLSAPPTSLPFATSNGGAENVRADQLLLNRLALDLLRQQRGEDERALRVADQHHAAALVVALQVRPPRIAHVVVPHARVEGNRGRPASRCRSPASVSWRYIGANVRHFDPKRANC